MPGRLASLILGLNDKEARDALERFVGDAKKTLAKTQEGAGLSRGLEPLGAAFKSGLKESGELFEILGRRAGQATALITSPLALGATAALGLGEGLREAFSAARTLNAELSRSKPFLKPEDVGTTLDGIHAIESRLGSTTEKLQVFRTALLDTGDPKASLEMTRLAMTIGKVTDTSPEQAVRTTV